MKLLEKLNPEQREAVTYGSGPLLIVAGAGTGKTSVITRRIAWLIGEGKAKPQEILALTFTEKAAREMEDRVFELLPLGQAMMQISTFHSFGDRLLKDYSYELGLPPAFDVLTEPEQVLLLREHLYDLPLTHLRPRGNPESHLRDLVATFSRAKDENRSADDYLAWVKDYEKEVAAITDPELKAEAESVLRYQREIAAAYDFYETKKRELYKLDFGDQVFMAFRLLRENKAVLNRVRKQFKYVLVDEFQDTNPIQNELVTLLAGINGNLTVVGDDDQGIYGFRGAALTNILDFEKIHTRTKRVVLKHNYRSTQQILDASYRLIQHNNPHRLEVQDKLDKQLVASEPPGPDPKIINVQTVHDEADSVAGLFAKQHKAGVPWKEMAVLTRTRKMGEPFRQALALQDIPAVFETTGSLYQRPEVKLCLAFLRVVDNPLSSTYVHALAISEVYGFPRDEMYALEKERSRTHAPLWELLADLNPMRFSETAIKAAQRLREDVAHFGSQLESHDVGHVLYLWLSNHTRILKRLSEPESVEDEIIAQNLSKLFGRIKAFSVTADDPSVSNWLSYFDAILKIEDEPAASEIDIDQDAVRILSVHKAKGLEFDTVVVAACTQNEFPQSGRTNQINCEPLWRHQPADYEQLHEERRLFYVAMTRAKRQLFMTYAADYGGKQTVRPSVFLAEAAGEKAVGQQPAALPSSLERIRQSAPLPIVGAGYLPPMPLVLSWTAINSYLTCPLKYYWEHVHNLYIEPNHALQFGTLMHQIVRDINLARQRGQAMTEAAVLRRYDELWKIDRFLSKQHERDSYEKGRHAVLKFLKEELDRLPAKAIEQNFKFKLSNCYVQGRFDRVEEQDGKVALIDYKTSSVTEQLRADKRAANEYQLVLYALALYKDTGKVPDTVALYFLESGLIGTATPTMRRIENMEQRIEDVADNILKGNFEPNTKQHECTPAAYNFCPGNTSAHPVEA